MSTMLANQVSENGITLYCCLGESLCAVQILEDALSHAIVMKRTEPNQKEKADNLFRKERRYTFGMALDVAKKESLLPKSLEIELSKLLDERNWLVHKSISNDKEGFKSDSFFKELFQRTKAITLKAHELQISVERDLIEYSEKKGIDMSKIRNEMKKHGK